MRLARSAASAAKNGVKCWDNSMGVDASMKCWHNDAMGDMRKITVDVDERVLEAARAEGAGVAETVREALERQARARAWERLAALRGKVKVDIDLNELRKDKDEE